MKVRHLATLAVLACCAIFGTQVALASKAHHSRRHHPHGFAVLAHHRAKISNARQQLLGIPSSAALARSAAGNNIYVFQRVQNLQAQICVAEEGPEMGGGSACGSIEAAEREGISLITPNPDGTQRLVLLVPNGVKTISVTMRNDVGTAADGTNNATATVANNVAVIEGDIAAYHFATPAGADESVPMESN